MIACVLVPVKVVNYKGKYIRLGSEIQYSSKPQSIVNGTIAEVPRQLTYGWIMLLRRPAAHKPVIIPDSYTDKENKRKQNIHCPWV